jgi:hypothetical protein
MATVTLGLTGSTVVNGTKTWTISDADVQILIDSITEKNTGGDENKPAPTPAQALGIWAQSFIRRTVQEVSNYRADKAKEATPIPPPIVFS